MHFRRLAIFVLAAGFVLISAAGSALASEQSDVLATVQRFVGGINKNDANIALAACASSASIIDDIPPHVWRGPTACADWWSAYSADNKKSGISDGVVTLHTPWHVAVTGDRAYVVVPTSYTYKQNGRPVTESGSVLTVALQKLAAGWRMTGWAWAQH